MLSERSSSQKNTYYMTMFIEIFRKDKSVETGSNFIVETESLGGN